jgi:dTDP-4-dehydrorhamnose 3,5-epimerase-like enzyme
VVDTLKSFYEGGSGFGGRYVQIINGKTNEIYELTNDGCFCEIKHTVLIPPELNKTENRFFLETIKEQLLPEKRTSPDPSLDWMIKSSFSNVKLDSNSFFDLIIDPQISWINNEFEYPHSYYLEIEGDTLTQLYDTPYEAPEWLNKKDIKGFLIYYANNHYKNRSGDSLVLSDSNVLYKTFHTSHGVIVKKGDLYKWVFISDVALTGAPEKLRWESIKKVKLLEKYLIVQQDLPPTATYQLFVINIETGICGRLKYDFSNSGNDIDDEMETFLIQEESIILGVEEKQFTFKLKDIFKELETQYIIE